MRRDTPSAAIGSGVDLIGLGFCFDPGDSSEVVSAKIAFRVVSVFTADIQDTSKVDCRASVGLPVVSVCFVDVEIAVNCVGLDDISWIDVHVSAGRVFNDGLRYPDPRVCRVEIGAGVSRKN